MRENERARVRESERLRDQECARARDRETESAREREARRQREQETKKAREHKGTDSSGTLENMRQLSAAIDPELKIMFGVLNHPVEDSSLI